MADRTTKVTLTAQVSQYLAGMDAAQKKTAEFANGSAQKLAAQKQAFNTVGTAMLAMGAVAAAGVALAVKSFADFDAKMSQVKTLSHATAKEMNDLGTAALTLGQKIGFSATQVADAEIELVKAGISTKDIMGGALKGALELAAAGQIDVGNATEIATIALTQFNLKGKDVPHVADLLAAGADKALGGVSDLGEALKSGGLVASQFGVSLNETVGTLSAFANAGLIGETAGTDLRQMLLKLASPSAEAASTMKSLGINIYDASGKFVGMSGLAGQLADKMGKLDPATRNAALSTIFGSRAIAGANVLYKEGAKGIGDWTSKVNDTGFAAQQARGKMDNLQGDLKKLSAVFETDLIKSGSSANDVLRGTVQAVTTLATAFGNLPKPAQGAILAVGAVVAGVGLIGGTAFLAVPKVLAFKNAIADLGISMKGLSLAGGAVGIAVTGLVAILSVVSAQQAKMKQETDDLASSLDQQTAAVTKNTRAIALKQLHDNGSIEAANRQGVSLKTLTDASLGNADAQEKMSAALAKARKEIDKLLKSSANDDKVIQMRTDWNTLGKGVEATSGKLANAKRDIENAASAMDDGSKTTQTAADTYQSAADKAKDLADQIQNLTDEINKANGVGQDAISTNASYQDALSKVQDTIKQAKAGVDGYSTSLDTTTAAGADNAAMFSDLASKSQAAAKAQFDVDHNAVQYRENLKAGRQTLIDQITALTGNAAAAQTLADRIYAIPSEKEVQLLVNTADAEVQLAKLNAHLNQVAATRTATINVVTNSDGSHSAGMIARAGGGEIHGPGTSTSDSVLMWGSDGEFMINADAYAKNKALVQAINSGASLTSLPRMVPAPQQYASAPALAAPVSVQVVSNGIDLSGFLDVFVDGKLQRADRASGRRIGAGVR